MIRSAIQETTSLGYGWGRLSTMWLTPMPARRATVAMVPAGSSYETWVCTDRTISSGVTADRRAVRTQHAVAFGDQLDGVVRRAGHVPEVRVLGDEPQCAIAPAADQQRRTPLRFPLAPFGIDGRELAVLAALAAHGPVSQQEISQALTIDRTTMVALVDGLTAKGLVARKPDPSDRRKNLVEATAQGRSVAERAGPAVDEVERRFLEPVAATDREALLRILRELTG